MAENAYLHLLYDAWKEVMDKRPRGIEFATLVQVCKNIDRGELFPIHKLKSDPEFNSEASQLIQAVCSAEVRQGKVVRSRSVSPQPMEKTKIIALCGQMGTGKSFMASAIESMAIAKGMPCRINSFGAALKRFCSEYLEYIPAGDDDWELSSCYQNDSMQKYMCAKTEIPSCVDRWVENNYVSLAPHEYILDSCPHINGDAVSTKRIRDHLDRNFRIALRQHINGNVELTARRVLQIVASVFRDLCGENFWVSQLASSRQSSPMLVIDDLRFENEADWVKRHGGYIVYVKSPGIAAQTGAVGGHVSEKSISPALADITMINNHNGVDAQMSEALNSIEKYLSQ